MQLIDAAPEAAAEQLKAECAELYHCPLDTVQLIHAPYRLCPLGAHIDHQLGPVSAIAVRHGIQLAFVPNDRATIEIVSRSYAGSVCFDLHQLQTRTGDWADYARGAVAALQQSHTLRCGVSFLIAGQLSEAGISSSAAVGLGYLLALATANELTIESTELIELDRIIENQFLGLKNGVLDQSAIALAQADRLSIIDCRALTCAHVSQPEQFVFLAVYSGLREALVKSDKFNNRVEQCLQAGGVLFNLVHGTRLESAPLGDVSVEQWQQYGDQLPEMLRKRAQHFFSEAQRVHAGAHAWERSDRAEFGQLMIASGRSSIQSYETGSPEMIRLYEVLNECSGVWGARFSGAGFRGCAVALVDADRVHDIAEEVAARYQGSFPQLARQMWAFDTTACGGLTLR